MLEASGDACNQHGIPYNKNTILILLTQQQLNLFKHSCREFALSQSAKDYTNCCSSKIHLTQMCLKNDNNIKKQEANK